MGTHFALSLIFRYLNERSSLNRSRCGVSQGTRTTMEHAAGTDAGFGQEVERGGNTSPLPRVISGHGEHRLELGKQRACRQPSC
jgi:hypothetical protein